jgi:hypothetical protein
MSPATPQPRPPTEAMPVACVADGGCSYLRALSTIERLAGFNQTASFYATDALRCQHLGCWASQGGAENAERSPHGPPPIRFDSMRPTRCAYASLSSTGVAAPIPFVRSAMVDILSDAEGNYVERRTLKLDTLPERNDSLSYLYNYWCGLRAQTECQLSNIDPVHLMRAGVIGKLHIVDVRSSDPGEFRFDLFGYAVPMGRPERPRALPVAIYADATIRDYNTVRLTGVPRLQRVRARLGGISHHYTRIILPFLDAKGGISRLLVAIRQEAGSGLELKTAN